MKATKLCKVCMTVRDNPVRFPVPRHVVHPEDGKPNVWSIYSEAIGPDCRSVWRSFRSSTAALGSC
jgi:hypothetical protein